MANFFSLDGLVVSVDNDSVVQLKRLASNPPPIIVWVICGIVFFPSLLILLLLCARKKYIVEVNGTQCSFLKEEYERLIKYKEKLKSENSQQ